jgi:hypothetical protein
VYRVLPESGLEPDLTRFIEEHLPSVEHLEVLLLVSSSPEHWWTVRAVNDLLRSREDSIRVRLTELARDRLLEKSADEESFRLPETPELATLVNRLRNAYKDWRVRVIETIYKRPQDPASEFSRAFDFRKKNDG